MLTAADWSMEMMQKVKVKVKGSCWEQAGPTAGMIGGRMDGLNGMKSAAKASTDKLVGGAQGL